VNCYSLIRIALFVGACWSCSNAVGADEELLGIVAQKLASPSNPSIAPYLDRTSAADSSLPNAQDLKKISAFGMIFSGRANLNGDEFDTISYWADDSELKSAVAEKTFKAIASQLEQRHGPAKVAEVPNYDDGPPTTHVLRWHVADEVILLSIQRRSSFANLSLERMKRDVLLAGDQSEFWKATLGKVAEQPPSNETQRPQNNTKTNADSLTTPLKKPDVKPAQGDVVADQTFPERPASKRRTAAWPWLAGILVLGVIAGLIWKRRA